MLQWKQLKKTSLCKRAALVLVLAILLVQLISVRQDLSGVRAVAADLDQQVTEQTQSNLELSNAIENRDDPDFVEDIAREKLGLVSPNDRVFYITD